MPRIHLGIYMVDAEDTVNTVPGCQNFQPSAPHIPLTLFRRAIERREHCLSDHDKSHELHSFDSTEWYNNEREVGHCISSYLSSPSNKAGLKREGIFFTMKLKSNVSYDAARQINQKFCQAMRTGTN